MRQFICILALSTVFAPTAVCAFGGAISPLQNALASSCTVLDQETSVVYVFHTASDGTTGARYSLRKSPNLPWVWIQDLNFENVIGDSQSGVTVDYGECDETGLVLIQIVQWAGGNMTADDGCQTVTAVAHPEDATVLSATCSGTQEVAGGGTAIVSVDFGRCPCGGFPDTVPVHESTWGAIKELWGN